MIETASRIGNIALALVVPLALWQALSALQIVNPTLFPSPFSVWKAGVAMYDSGILFKDLSISLRRAAIGFLMGAGLGVAAGLLTSRIHFFSVALGPVFNLLRPIPAIALVPVAIVWFGIGEESKYFVIAYTVFLAVWLSTHHGMEHVPSVYIRAARSLGASRMTEFLQVVVPASAPHIVSGLRLGAALAFLSLVAAELTGASAGIGYRLDEARQYILIDRMFVGLIQLGVLGATLDGLFVLISRRLIHWEQA